MRNGPSPRARGSPRGKELDRVELRSIPACAGLTDPTRTARRRRSVHPRVRGAHDAPEDAVPGGYGPSPRARGSRRRAGWFWCLLRSIPACAGLTPVPARARPPAPVHPRVRGAHTCPSKTSANGSGPSPRARGSQVVQGAGLEGVRSIPACAGLTAGSRWRPSAPAVHPRVRGAHGADDGAGADEAGPSPRARGSPHGGPGRLPRGRSIPACAGLTSPRTGCRPPSTVHPRVRGAHVVPGPLGVWCVGPSPRARGSLSAVRRHPHDPRSIPACAGLTARWKASAATRTVHPRVRGAHPGRKHAVKKSGGPSPRARGSRSTPRTRTG